MIKFLFGIMMMFVCITSGCISNDEPKGPSLQVGDSIPQFSVILNTGEEVSTLSLRNKTAVIVFFNTNCSDCRKELPVIQQIWDIYKNNEEVEIVVIAREETKEEIQEYWEENGLTMPFSPQASREIYNLFATSIIPRIYIADSTGIITYSSDDSDMPSVDTLVSVIEKTYNF